MKRAHSSDETHISISSASSSRSPSPDSRFKEVIIIDNENSGRAKEADQQKYIKFDFGKITTLQCLDRLLTIPEETTFLNIGNIYYGPIIFPNSFGNLVKLKFDGIVNYNKKFIITLPDLLPNLKKLILWHIWGAIITCPKLMDGLEKLKIGQVGYDTTLKLPDSLNGLKSFSITDVMPDSLCVLPNKLDNLTTLKIGEPSYQAKNFKIPDSLPNLKSLIIGTLQGYALQLPKCDNLSNFTIKGIYSHSTFNLLETLDNLTSFTIEQLCSASIILPNSYSNMNYTIQEISHAMTNVDPENKIALPNQLNKPTTLSIGCINNGVILRIVDPSHNLTTLTIEKIGAYVTILLPDSSSNLMTLTIQEMNENVTFQAQDLLENLANIQNIRIGNFIEEDARNFLRKKIKALDLKCSIQ